MSSKSRKDPVKMDDLIAILGPINCALYRDKIADLGNFISVFCFERS